MVCHILLKCATHQNTYLQNKCPTWNEKNNEGKRKNTFQHGCFSVQTFARWTLFTLQLRRGLASWRRKFQATERWGWGSFHRWGMMVKEGLAPRNLTNWYLKWPYLEYRSHLFQGPSFWMIPAVSKLRDVSVFSFLRWNFDHDPGVDSLILFWTDLPWWCCSFQPFLDIYKSWRSFWQTKSDPAFSQKTDFPTKLKHHFSKKQEEERKKWLLFCSGLEVICWFHFISSWLGVVLSTYHRKMIYRTFIQHTMNFYGCHGPKWLEILEDHTP